MKGCIVITPESIYEGEDEVINTIISLGSRVHIRKPNSDVISLGNYCRKITTASNKEYITLNREYQMAIELGFGGVHVPYAKVEDLYNTNSSISNNSSKLIVSCSTHSFIEAQRADEIGASYYFLSPIFDSISKSGYTSNFDSGELTKFTQTHRRCVALGGVDITRLEELTHFYSIALLGAVWQIEDGRLNISKSIQQFKNINDRWQELKSCTI